MFRKGILILGAVLLLHLGLLGDAGNGGGSSSHAGEGVVVEGTVMGVICDGITSVVETESF